VYSHKDCDGDGVPDHHCINGGKEGFITSGDSCRDMWPTGICQAATVCVQGPVVIASCSASSAYWKTPCSKAHDGELYGDGWGTDGTAGQRGAGVWIQLNFEQETMIDRMHYGNRPGKQAAATRVKLTFSDGTTVEPNVDLSSGSSPTTVIFHTVATSSVKVEILAVDYQGNPGAAEISFGCEATPRPTPAPIAWKGKEYLNYCVDADGNDLPLEAKGTVSLAACQEMCTADDRCSGVEFYASGTTGACYHVTNEKAAAKGFSGPRHKNVVCYVKG